MQSAHVITLYYLWVCVHIYGHSRASVSECNKPLRTANTLKRWHMIVPNNQWCTPVGWWKSGLRWKMWILVWRRDDGGWVLGYLYDNMMPGLRSDTNPSNRWVRHHVHIMVAERFFIFRIIITVADCTWDIQHQGMSALGATVGHVDTRRRSYYY